MGFRLYVNKDICCGKLYGYAEDSQHLYSIDWLVLHGVFNEDFKYWDRKTCPTLYDVAIAEFDSAYRLELDLSYNDFLEFFSLYLADFIIRIRKEYNTSYPISQIKEWIDEIEKLPKDKDVHLQWM